MSSSMVLSAEDLARGEVNTQNEVWVKPGCSFAVPIAVHTPETDVSWEFTVQPKVGWCVCLLVGGGGEGWGLQLRRAHSGDRAPNFLPFKGVPSPPP